MDRKPMTYADLINATRRFVDRHLPANDGFTPCPIVSKAYSSRSGLKAVQLPDGTYRICNVEPSPRNP